MLELGTQITSKVKQLSELASPLHEQDDSGRLCLEKVLDSVGSDNLFDAREGLNQVEKAIDREAAKLSSIHIKRNADSANTARSIGQELALELNYGQALSTVSGDGFIKRGAVRSNARVASLLNSLVHKLPRDSEPLLRPASSDGLHMATSSSGLLLPSLGGISDLSIHSKLMPEAGSYVENLFRLLDVLICLRFSIVDKENLLQNRDELLHHRAAEVAPELKWKEKTSEVSRTNTAIDLFTQVEIMLVKLDSILSSLVFTIPDKNTQKYIAEQLDNNPEFIAIPDIRQHTKDSKTTSPYWSLAL